MGSEQGCEVGRGSKREAHKSMSSHRRLQHQRVCSGGRKDSIEFFPFNEFTLAVYVVIVLIKNKSKCMSAVKTLTCLCDD